MPSQTHPWFTSVVMLGMPIGVFVYEATGPRFLWLGLFSIAWTTCWMGWLGIRVRREARGR